MLGWIANKQKDAEPQDVKNTILGGHGTSRGGSQRTSHVWIYTRLNVHGFELKVIFAIVRYW